MRVHSSGRATFRRWTAVLAFAAGGGRMCLGRRAPLLTLPESGSSPQRREPDAGEKVVILNITKVFAAGTDCGETRPPRSRQHLGSRDVPVVPARGSVVITEPGETSGGGRACPPVPWRRARDSLRATATGRPRDCTAVPRSRRLEEGTARGRSRRTPAKLGAIRLTPRVGAATPATEIHRSKEGTSRSSGRQRSTPAGPYQRVLPPADERCHGNENGTTRQRGTRQPASAVTPHRPTEHRRSTVATQRYRHAADDFIQPTTRPHRQQPWNNSNAGGNSVTPTRPADNGNGRRRKRTRAERTPRRRNSNQRRRKCGGNAPRHRDLVEQRQRQRRQRHRRCHPDRHHVRQRQQL
jgi:hypothetical protein